MALARQCGARALVLLAGGNLRALVALLCLGLAWALLRPRVAAWPQARAQRIAARSTHQLLYALLLLMPLSGFLGSVFSGYPIRFFGLQLPQLAQRWDAAKALCSALHQASAIALGLLGAAALRAAAGVALEPLGQVGHHDRGEDGQQPTQQATQQAPTWLRTRRRLAPPNAEPGPGPPPPAAPSRARRGGREARPSL